LRGALGGLTKPKLNNIKHLFKVFFCFHGMGVALYRQLMKMLFSLLLSMSIITACQRSAPSSPAEKYLPAQNFLNLAYGNDSLQKMDVYLPEGRTAATTKSIILIHGGGWNGGSKSEFAEYIDSFKRRMPGYAIFNLNYRLVNGGNLFPAQETDIKDAVDFIAENAVEYAIDENSLVLLGASAGGHLALLQAYKYNTPKIKAVIDFFGPSDLIAMYRRPWHPLVPYALQMITGTTPDLDAGIYEKSSPVNFVSTRSAPTLIFHGGNDTIVDVSQSKALKNKLDRAGVVNELVVYPGERHGWRGNTLRNSFDRIESFLKTNVP
jgi:acetyl esterase/lipase